MTINLITPRMGEGVTQVTVVRWLKQAGDPVKEYEPLVEVETDKVITEIPSPAEGVLARILVPAEQVALVGQPLAEIATASSPVAAPPSPAAATSASVPAVAPALPLQPALSAVQSTAAQRTWISPLVAKMAAEHRVDLSQVPGSGLNGRITKQDLLDFLSARPQDTPATPPPASPDSQTDLQPLTPMRRRIAERMVASLHTAPHVLTVMEADLSRVLAHLEQNKARFASDGIRLTLTAYFIEAIAKALRAYPLVNSSWTEGGIQLHRQMNIGMAVSLGDEGLIVPVIREADLLSLGGIARTVNTLAERARAHQLTPDDVRGGTFSLTNHGTGKSLFATPIINQPQTGILGTGALHKRPIVITDELGRDSIAIRPMIYLSFVFDHRILDGAAADGFLSSIKTFLEAYQ